MCEHAFSTKNLVGDQLFYFVDPSAVAYVTYGLRPARHWH